MTRGDRMTVVMSLVLAGLFASALGVVYAKYQSRKLFVELQALNSERDKLEIEWGRLQLEQSTWATPSRVEEIARRRLDMQIPEASKVVIMTP